VPQSLERDAVCFFGLFKRSDRLRSFAHPAGNVSNGDSQGFPHGAQPAALGPTGRVRSGKDSRLRSSWVSRSSRNSDSIGHLDS
jgi:hypothetical protein